MNNYMKKLFENYRADCSALTDEEFTKTTTLLVDTFNEFVDICDRRGGPKYFYESAADNIARHLGIKDNSKVSDIEFLAFEFSMFDQ